MDRHPTRMHGSYAAFLAHRLSGLALAIFLPFHFLTLGLALEGAEGLDGFLAFADQPLVKLGEWLLVILLSLHLFFGARLLLLEFGGWRDGSDLRVRLAGLGAGAALLIGILFLVRAF